MQVKHIRTLCPAQDAIARIEAICWSPNNKRIAVADAGRFVNLYDEFGERRERFSTRPADGGKSTAGGGRGSLQRTFAIKGMAFSFDSTKIAIAQSDFIVFVYRLGLEWGEKKSICNKFPQNSAITCLTWPQCISASTIAQEQDRLCFGTDEGKVKIAINTTNKSQVLFSHESGCVSICASPDGRGLVTGHNDGSIFCFVFEKADNIIDPSVRTGNENVNMSSLNAAIPIGVSKIATHNCIPYALSWAGAHFVCVSGQDCIITLYDPYGNLVQTFPCDPVQDKEHTALAASLSGHTIAVAAYDKIRLLNYSIKKQKWEEGVVTDIKNAYSIECLTWKSDGSRLLTGTMTGAIDMFDACLKRCRVAGGAFEYTYVSLTQVIVKRISSGAKIVLKSTFGNEILKINVHKNRYLVGHTISTLLIGDLESYKLAEVPWRTTGKEMFYFDVNPEICVIFTPASGEFCIVEYGCNEILGKCTASSNSNAKRISVSIYTPTATTADGTEVGGYRSKSRRGDNPRKLLAYLIDRQTIQVEEFITGMIVANIPHSHRIDWLSLNYRGTKLLFRNKRHQLFLYDLLPQLQGKTERGVGKTLGLNFAPSYLTNGAVEQNNVGVGGGDFFPSSASAVHVAAGIPTKTTLLPYCTFVQWVFESDVVVAQSRTNLCVWYSIDTPDRVAMVPIKGQVVGVERTALNGKEGSSRERSTLGTIRRQGEGGGTSDGETVSPVPSAMVNEVIVNEGVNTVAYRLDESLIEFGSAMDDSDYDRACDLLDQIALTPETEVMWQSLSSAALGEMQLNIAERGFAALGDVASANAVHKINALAQQHGVKDSPECGEIASIKNNSYNHYSIRAELFILNRNFQRAEQIYIDNGHSDLAIKMWEDLGQKEEALRVAEESHLPDAALRRQHYFTWLRETEQNEKAGELCEREGKFLDAIDLYLAGGVPARAASVVSQHGVKPDPRLLEAIASALVKLSIYEKAGELFESVKMTDRAIDAYKKGGAYVRAVDLAKRELTQAEVFGLEAAWGEYLVSMRLVDQAINHFIEAGQLAKAVGAAIESRRWNKAVSITDSINIDGYQEKSNTNNMDPILKTYFKQIASHFEELHQLSEAEKYYIKSGSVSDAVDMYAKASLSDHMFRVAQEHLTEQEMIDLFISQAERLESRGDYADAERIYLKINNPDKAILMYKKCRDFTSMVRLVGIYRADYLQKTLISLANSFAKEGDLKLAERHFVEGKDWQRAVAMYESKQLWDDAVRVARAHGGEGPAHDVVIARALQWSGEEGVRFLMKHQLVTAGINAALEGGKFELAQQWAQLALPGKLSYVYLKMGMDYEDRGKFAQAEEYFLKADKPREAIDMHVHLQDFDAAFRIAEARDSAAIAMICVSSARLCFENNHYTDAERLLLQKSKQPDILIKLYREAGMLSEAQRIAKDYAPEKVSELSKEIAASLTDPAQAGLLLEQNGEYQLAIESYLKVTRDNYVGNFPPELLSSRSVASILGTNGGISPSLRVSSATSGSTVIINATDGGDVKKYSLPPTSAASAMDRDFAFLQVWARAVRLALLHERSMLQDTLSVVTRRMTDMEKYVDAAQCWEAAGDVKAAIDCYISGGLLDFAEGTATTLTVGDDKRKEQLLSYIKEARVKRALKESSQSLQARETLGALDQNVALKAYVENNDWVNALNLARQKGSDEAKHYTVMFCQYLSRLPPAKRSREELLKGLNAIVMNGMETQDFRFFESWVQFALAVASQLLSSPINFSFSLNSSITPTAHNSGGDAPVPYQSVPPTPSLSNVSITMVGFYSPGGPCAVLHKGLIDLVANIDKTGQDPALLERGRAVRDIVHIYYTTHRMATIMQEGGGGGSAGFGVFAVRLLLCLPRYVKVFPADKAFFDAGIAAKQFCMKNIGRAMNPREEISEQLKKDFEAIAFIFLNCFLDMTEKIEDGETFMLLTDDKGTEGERQDFSFTDYPRRFPLPSTPTIPHESYVEANKWVLATSVQQETSLSLPLIYTPKGQQMFIAALCSPNGTESFESCAITGGPVLGGSTQQREQQHLQRKDGTGAEFDGVSHCRGCNHMANRDDWNKYTVVVKECPWCGAPAVPDFSIN